MFGNVPILHSGLMETTHPAAGELYGFRVEWLVITGPASLPNLTVNSVKLLQILDVQVVGIEKLKIVWSDIIGIFKK
jgi:hypothetical protein